MTRTITRSEILGTSGRRRIEHVHIVGYGDVHVRSITEGERAGIEDATRNDPKLARILLIIASVCDADGTPMFGKADVEALREADSRITMALSNAIAAHIQPVDIEDKLKNLPETHADASP